jgi:mono/diheme cytochrome c family protein
MILRTFFLGLAVAVATTVMLLGFRGRHGSAPPWELFADMDRQPKVKFQAPILFFADGRGARVPVEGTVPLGYEIPRSAGRSPAVSHVEPSPRFGSGTDYEATGRMGERWGDGIPVPVDAALLARGRERFEIFCGVCHGRVGLGNGVPGELGLVAIGNLQDRRIRDMADGQIFSTITGGKNTMMGYGDKLPVRDRWAVVAYVRALQTSQGTDLAGLPAALRGEFEQATGGR